MVKMKLLTQLTLSITLLSGCASVEKPPVTLTNSQFKCSPKPPVPQDINITTREGQIIHGGYIVDMEVAYDNCQNRLYEIRDVIQVQGGVVTDTLVEKQRDRFLGIF